LLPAPLLRRRAPLTLSSNQMPGASIVADPPSFEDSSPQRELDGSRWRPGCTSMMSLSALLGDRCVQQYGGRRAFPALSPLFGVWFLFPPGLPPLLG
jgi:hypothetical protein